MLMSELVTNAVKYAHPTGLPAQIEVVCRQTARDLIIEIADDGIGLPENFDPLTDGGLGFRIVRSLASQLGATVRFDSDALGTRVQLKLPVSRDVIRFGLPSSCCGAGNPRPALPLSGKRMSNRAPSFGSPRWTPPVPRKPIRPPRIRTLIPGPARSPAVEPLSSDAGAGARHHLDPRRAGGHARRRGQRRAAGPAHARLHAGGSGLCRHLLSDRRGRAALSSSVISPTAMGGGCSSSSRCRSIWSARCSPPSPGICGASSPSAC